MANSGGAPENFGEYDVFADVSQHGSSVFDFFGSVGLSAHQMPPSILSYSLENGQQQLDTAMTYPFPVFSTAMNIDQPPPKTATGSAKKSDLAPQSAPTVNQTPQTAAQASSAKPEMVVKPTASAERKTVKKTIAKTLGPKAVRPPFPGQDMSLSTVSALPPNPKRSLAVFSAQSGVVTASGVGASSSSPPNEGTGMSPSPSAVTQLGAGQDIHNSHTRRCRAKVNNKFAELLQILPTPPPKTGVKHKAQILDYTIRVFREIYAKKLYLEAELALSSRTHLNNWVESIVRPATVLADVLNPFMSLLCTKEKFAYAESWVRVEPTEGGRKGGILPRGTADSSAQSRGQFVNTSAGLEPKAGMARWGSTTLPVPCNVGTAKGGMQSFVPSHAPLRLGTTVVAGAPGLQKQLEMFRDRSRSFVCQPRVDPAGRIMCTMRPEWLSSLSDEEAFQRAGLAKEAGLSVCFGLPFFVRGRIVAVVLFFDVAQRSYDAHSIDLGDSIAGLLGNAFGARLEKDMR